MANLNGLILPNEQSSLPTISLYAFTVSCVVDAMDAFSKVIIVDIPGAFLQYCWPQNKHSGYIMINGLMVEKICKVNPTYCDKVQYSKESSKPESVGVDDAVNFANKDFALLHSVLFQKLAYCFSKPNGKNKEN